MSLRGFFLIALLSVIASAAVARDAAFLDPNSSVGAGAEAVKIDPKPDIDVGDTVLGVAKRTSVFFVNQTNLPVKIEKVTVNNDSNVTAEATADDCTKQGVIAPLSRCSVEISTTPTSPGSWSVDVLMTHDGAGRLTRAKLTGKTSGSTSESKSTGLSVNTKEVKPIDFGDVDVGSGKVVRSTLMVNDSAEPITLYSIDVIEADNGLQRLDQGCAVDMELAPGASCPVTLLWVPQNNGPVSTDLIIRHSGKLGFAVIPIRGNAKGGLNNSAASSKGGSNKSVVPLPPSADQLDKAMAGAVAPVPAAALGAGSNVSGGDGSVHLIGTVGEHALILKADGGTEVLAVGETFEQNGKTAKITSINAHSMDITVEGAHKILKLEAAQSLVDKAREASQQTTQGGATSPSSSSSTSSSSLSAISGEHK